MLNDEHVLTLAEAPKLLPGRPHASSLWRWCRKGIKARNGTIIRLEHRRLGGRVLTSAEALDRFGAALAEADVSYFDEAPGPRPSATRAPRQRERDMAQAEAELAEAGL